MRRGISAVLRWCTAACVAAAAYVAQAAILERPGIRIEYPAGAETLAQESAETIAHARDEYQERLPKSPAQLTVVICGTVDEFAGYAGALSARSVLGIAKPGRDLIVLKSPSLVAPGPGYGGTVRHELVHILLEHNANTDHMPRWLNEGIAMTLSGEDRWAGRTLVASMYLNGRILSYRDLEASFLDPGNEIEFGDAYAQAYSMTRYLWERLGDDRFWALVHSLDTRSFGTAIEAELGVVPYDFWAAWKGSLGWAAAVYSVVSGVSLFQIMALLTLAAYWRKRRRGQRLIEQWEEEDAHGPGPGAPE